MNPSIITATNLKGGVGKTTTVVNLGSALALIGRKVLVVDLDPQANSTSQLGADPDVVASGRNVKRAIEEDLTLGDIRVPTNMPGIDLLPAVRSMDKLVESIFGQPNQYSLLRELLNCPEKNEYDVILVDTHPSKDCFFQSALAASHYYIVPLFAEPDSVSGLSDLFSDVERIRRYQNPMLMFLGCVVTKFDKANATHVAYEKKLRASAKAAKFHVFNTSIPNSQSVAAAAASGIPLHKYRKQSPVTMSYTALAGELLPHLKGQRVGRKMAPINTKAIEAMEIDGLEINF